MGRVRTGKALVSREQCKPGAGTVPKRTLEVGAEALEIFLDGKRFPWCVGFTGKCR